jgi:hypothetical protein
MLEKNHSLTSKIYPSVKTKYCYLKKKAYGGVGELHKEVLETTPL